MTDKDYSLEVVYQIWDNIHGTHLEIGPDADALGLLQIRAYEKDQHIPFQEIIFCQEQAKLIIEALTRAIKDVEV